MKQTEITKFIIKKYGRPGGKKKVVPEHYDQNLIFECSFKGVRLATGKWTKRGFVIFKNSHIMQEYFGQNNKGINLILSDLQKDNVIFESYPYFTLTQDILVHLPSTAASLVNGNSRTGFRDWKNNGKMLESIIAS
jgi:hypothetical protein